MRKSSFPLRNLRGVLILLILAFHSFSAYIVTQPAETPPFDQPPYNWAAFPIIDSQRWLGFDLFCAAQFLYLMQIMFFLSGLFVWQGLLRKGAASYLGQRLIRLGLPFLIGIYLEMPIAFYATYRATAVDPSWSTYWSHWMALPITPTGPMWFLWFLVALNVIVVALFRFVPEIGGVLTTRLVSDADAHPSRLFWVLVVLSAITYLPLSAIYTPWKWIAYGPFEVQGAMAPQYVLYFVAGLAVGAYGYHRGLLDPDGMLVRRWALWVTVTFGAFLLWIIPNAVMVKAPDAGIPGLGLLGDLGLVIFAAAATFSFFGVFVRFAPERWAFIDSISENAYGIYFFHYLFVLWLQYALLELELPAVVKGLMVFFCCVLLSWGAAVGTNATIVSARTLLLGRRTTFARQPSATNGRLSETTLSD
jgi:glucans biosynthesis protein C